VRAGEADFRGWVAENRASLRRTAFLLCGDWYLADDLVQDTLVRVYSVWDRVASTGSPNAYVRKALVNAYLMHLRRPSRRERPVVALPEATSPGDHPSDGVRDQVIIALREVPAGQRAVLVLRYWEDQSVEETARMLSTSAGNVKSQSSRGLVALRAALAAQGLPDAIDAAKEPS